MFRPRGADESSSKRRLIRKINMLLTTIKPVVILVFIAGKFLSRIVLKIKIKIQGIWLSFVRKGYNTAQSVQTQLHATRWIGRFLEYRKGNCSCSTILRNDLDLDPTDLNYFDESNSELLIRIQIRSTIGLYKKLLSIFFLNNHKPLLQYVLIVLYTMKVIKMLLNDLS